MCGRFTYMASLVLILGLVANVGVSKVIDDFESGNLAAWDISVGPDVVSVGPDPTDPGNQCMVISAGETRIRIPWGLPEGETETLYYRFMYETAPEGGTVNLHVGATDPVDTEWGDYYGLSRFSSYHDPANVPDMDVRDGGAYSDLVYTDFEPLRWYQVVLEYDTAAKTYDVYIDAELVFNDATFRSGYTPTNLEYILIRTTTWQGNFANGTVYVDDITVGATPGFEQAAAPSPKNGATLEGTWASLSWRPGVSAVSSDLYVGTNFDDVNDGAPHTFIGNVTDSVQLIGFTGFPLPEGLQPGTTYYWRVDGVNPDNPDSPWKGTVWSFWVPSKAAYNPLPVDGMKFIDTDAVLEWSPGENAALHTVYFGTDADEVANATSGGADQGAATFDPGPLELETTYYWRVDEHAGLVETKGQVWSFTTRREGGGLRGDYYDTGGGTPDPPESAFSGQPVLTRIDPGIDFEGAGGTSPEPNVVSGDAFAVLWTGEIEIPLTGKYTFIPRTADGVVLWIDGVENARGWRVQPPESVPGRPLELSAGDIVAVEMWYYQSGGDWAVRLDWVSDRFERQTVPAAACSPPLRASRSQPANGAVDTSHTPQLTWSAGQDAAEHDVYFGADADAVAAADITAADIYQGRQAETSFTPGELELNTTYYWRIDEVNDAHPESPWKGSVWSFTTADFLILDDFEGYDAYDNQIWWTWKDGLGYVAHDDEPEFGGNGTGSIVGDDTTASYTEEVTTHGGAQAMPVFYNNGQAAAKYSEVELTLTVSRNWTQDGMTQLSLWFHGDPANSAEGLYVAVSNAGGQPVVVYHEDPAAAQIDAWTQWTIPLQTFADQGIDLSNVDKLVLGIGTRGNTAIAGGTGKMLFDDIRLLR
ncbi:MAG: PA14 domain-containing protein [Planctomycetota bacterium]